jgi:4-aminobutyrate aminotransferase-like enzyme/Ser/Thr protein kinase RdoA (MazF antagonist)
VERNEGRVDPLETAPPNFSGGGAADIARRFFGIEGTASPLGAERDQNFRLRAGDDSFVLKFSNPADDPVVLDMQTQAMLHLARVDPGLPVMQPLPAIAGGYVEKVRTPDDRVCFARACTFLPGEMRNAADLDGDALKGFGRVVARVGIGLRGFFHPSGGYDILWDLKQTSRLRDMIGSIEGPGRRAVVETVLERFEARVAPVLPTLRAQLIHNDLTLDNVLLDDSLCVSGVVDFGDLTHTALVCDLAIALVSLMWGRDDPVTAARLAVSGYLSVTSLDERELSILGDLVGARLAGLVTIAAWRVRRYPENAAYIMANADLAWRLLEQLDALRWPKLEEALSAVQSRGMLGSRPGEAELLARRGKVLGPALSPLSYDEPLYLVRGEGAAVIDREGTEYLDAYNNVPVVGHSHPHVSAAIAAQSAALNTNTRYLHESVVELAERLVATMPGGLDTVMFYNSGSEANDIAWRLATTFTGASGAIVTARAYHGVTTAPLALSPEEWTDPEGPGHVATVPAPRGLRSEGDDVGQSGVHQQHFDDAIAKLAARGFRPAAFYLDSLFTSDGIFTPPPHYLQEAVKRVRGAGALFVADEVQCGFGRSGTDMWSFERYGVVPDLVTLGKPMGNGYPVAAVITRREIAERFAATIDLFSTFGGNPVAARAGLAVLDVIEREDLVDHAGRVGQVLKERLVALAERYAVVDEVRGAGLLIGVEIVDAAGEPHAKLAHSLANEMRRRHVLIGTTGPHDNVLKIRPPLVITDEDARTIAGTLEASLRHLVASH